MVVVEVLIVQQLRKEIYASIGYAAYFHALIEDWKNGDDIYIYTHIAPRGKEALLSVQ